MEKELKVNLQFLSRAHFGVREWLWMNSLRNELFSGLYKTGRSNSTELPGPSKEGGHFKDIHLLYSQTDSCHCKHGGDSALKRRWNGFLFKQLSVRWRMGQIPFSISLLYSLPALDAERLQKEADSIICAEILHICTPAFTSLPARPCSDKRAQCFHFKSDPSSRQIWDFPCSSCPYLRKFSRSSRLQEDQERSLGFLPFTHSPDMMCDLPAQAKWSSSWLIPMLLS